MTDTPLDAAGLAEAGRALVPDMFFDYLQGDEDRMRSATVVAGKAIRAYLASAEPAGWRLVPVEPTEAMLVAACPYFVAPYLDAGRKAWGAMLSAAPLPTPQGDETP